MVALLEGLEVVSAMVFKKIVGHDCDFGGRPTGGKRTRVRVTNEKFMVKVVIYSGISFLSWLSRQTQEVSYYSAYYSVRDSGGRGGRKDVSFE